MDPWQGKKEGRKLSQWSQEGQPLKRLKIDFLSSDSLKVGHDILWQNRNSENIWNLNERVYGWCKDLHSETITFYNVWVQLLTCFL